MVINEDLAKEIGLDDSVVYSVMFLILCTDTYKDKFKGCRVKKEPNTVFITISKLREIIPFMSKSKLYNSVNRLLKRGYIKEANYRLPRTNTTKCYTIGGKYKTSFSLALISLFSFFPRLPLHIQVYPHNANNQ